MKLYLIATLVVFFQLPSVAQSQYRDTEWIGKRKVNTVTAFGWVTKDWVRYTLHKDSETASAHRYGFPEARHKVHIYIEDTVAYKGKKYVVTEIEENAWMRADRILSARLPNNIKKIPVGAFFGCVCADSISIPPSVISIHGYAFSESGIRSIVFPDSLEMIGSYAFSYCNNLRHVVLPANIKRIHEGAFSHCAQLTTVKMLSNTPPEAVAKDILGTSPVFGTTTKARHPILLVPKGSLESYKNADGWKKFPDIREYESD